MARFITCDWLNTRFWLDKCDTTVVGRTIEKNSSPQENRIYAESVVVEKLFQEMQSFMMNTLGAFSTGGYGYAFAFLMIVFVCPNLGENTQERMASIFAKVTLLVLPFSFFCFLGLHVGGMLYKSATAFGNYN